MEIEFTGRNIRVSKALKKLATERLEKIARHVVGAQQAHVILVVEKRRHIAELVLIGRKDKLSGQAETDDMYASLNLVLDRIERQARKHRDKLITSKRRSASRGSEVVADDGMEVANAGEPTATAVIEAQAYYPPALSLEEAVLRLEAEAEPFVLFRDTKSQRLQLLHLKPNGRFVLLEPQP